MSSIYELGAGVAALATAATLTLQAILPTPVPFVMHSLQIEGGIVTQDRTIQTSEAAFYAAWAATVENADTGESVRWCEGSGANPYPPGRKAVTFSLPEWTGRAECTLENLPPGRYALRGSWRWGEDGTSIKSNVFEVTR